jgi:Methyltransferase FkbM domain
MEQRELFIPEKHQPAAWLLKPAGASKAIRTETVSPDDYFSETDRVSAIKIDVEGAELDVLQGARHTLARCTPLLVFECDRHNASVGRMEATFSFLFRIGYAGEFVSGAGLRPFSEFDVDVHQRCGRRMVLEEQGILQ